MIDSTTLNKYFVGSLAHVKTNSWAISQLDPIVVILASDKVFTRFCGCSLRQEKDKYIGQVPICFEVQKFCY